MPIGPLVFFIIFAIIVALIFAMAFMPPNKLVEKIDKNKKK